MVFLHRFFGVIANVFIAPWSTAKASAKRIWRAFPNRLKECIRKI
jgi:hypothetical protein